MAKKKIDKDWESLAGELKELIPQLDSEGLAFLVQQARVHLYNMQVDKLNNAAIAADASTAKLAKHKTKSSEKAKTKGNVIKITGTESGSSYYLYYGANSSMLSKSEMTHLIKMVYAGGTDMEVRERLYRWLDQERRDIFSVIPVRDKFDDTLKSLAVYIKKNYTLK